MQEFLIEWHDRLILFYDLFVGAFLTAVFCFLLDYCLKPGQIFGFWRIMLAKRILNRNVPNWRNKMEPKDDATEGLQELTEENKQDIASAKKLKQKKFHELIVDVASDFAYLEKPLGMCMICMNVWWALGTIWLTALPNLVCEHWYFFWVFIIYPALSSFFLRKMNQD